MARNRDGNPSRERTPPVPAFHLYGEPVQAPDEREIHVEALVTRSARHDWNIHPHRHAALHQVFLLQRGRVAANLDGRTIEMRAPGFIVVPPSTVHSFRFQPGSEGLVISFAAGFATDVAKTAAGLAAMLDEPATVPLDRAALRATDANVLGELLLREFGHSAPGRHAALGGLLSALLANLLRLAPADVVAPTAPGPQRELVARFRELIERRHRDHASLASLTRELGVSERRLRRACLAVCGIAPLELLHQRLLLEAERQLRYTAVPVTQIAYDLGFDDPAYFSRFFTRRAGMSPRAFRARPAHE